MKKNFFLKLLILVVLFLPICVNAENKIYFEVDEATIAPGATKKINIKVDSDEDFKKVNFNLITTSVYVGFYSVDFNEAFVRNSSSTTGSNYELESKEVMPSGTIIGSVTLQAKSSSPIGEEGYIRLTKASITTSSLKELTSSQVKMVVSNEKSKNNNLQSLSSNMADIAFDKDVLEYTVLVDSNVKVFDLSATAEDSASIVEISDQNLKKPSNIIKVTVTPEQGDKKVYKVTVNKKEDKKITTKKPKEEKKDVDNSNIKSGWFGILTLLILVLGFDILYIKKKR